jgi:hypothetical protein
VAIEDGSNRRVKFYGLNDYGTYFQVERAAEILDDTDGTPASYGVNEMLELHNAQLFAESDLFPPTYTEAQRAEGKARLPEIRKTTAQFFNAIDDANVATVVVDVDFQYQRDLLELLDRHRVYDRCSATTILPVLEATHIGLAEMLTNKRLVQRYDEELRDTLLADPSNAEHLIRYYLERDARPVHLPASLTAADARMLLDRYVESDDANPNFLELIATARVSKGAPIDAKLKLKAKRKRDAWAESFFKDKAGIESGCEVSISDTQVEPVEMSLDGLVAKFSYSRQWLEDNLDYPTILNNFIYLFEFANGHMLLTLPSYQAELGVLERVMRTAGKETYLTGTAFRLKEHSSLLQTVLYDRFLRTKDIELESVIAWFFADYLREHFDAIDFRFVPSTKTSSYLERARHLFSEMESVIKQFTLYVENGELDTDLLAMTSEQVRYKSIPSLLAGKYVYASDDQEIRNILQLLFSDQSEIRYISEDLQAADAARLLIKNQVAYEDFADYQKPAVDYLIGLGVLQMPTAGSDLRTAISSSFSTPSLAPKQRAPIITRPRHVHESMTW